MISNRSVYSACDYGQVHMLLNIMSTVESNNFNNITVIRGLIDAPTHLLYYLHLDNLRPNDYPIFGKSWSNHTCPNYHMQWCQYKTDWWLTYCEFIKTRNGVGGLTGSCRAKSMRCAETKERRKWFQIATSCEPAIIQKRSASATGNYRVACWKLACYANLEVGNCCRICRSRVYTCGPWFIHSWEQK